MNIKNIIKWFLPHYETLESVVFIKEGTKSEIEDAIPLQDLTEKAFEDFLNPEYTPTGVAQVQYFNWTFFQVAGKVVMSDIVPWDKYLQPVNEEESERLGEVTVEVCNKVLEAIGSIDLKEDEKVYLTMFEGVYQKGDSEIPFTAMLELQRGDSE